MRKPDLNKRARRKKRVNKIREKIRYLHLMSGRPERDRIISKDDILNLKIALNTEYDLNAFLSRL